MKTFALLALLALAGPAAGAQEPGVFVRFRLMEPAAGAYYVRLGGYIHIEPWYLKPAVLPAGADRDPKLRLPAGMPTGWFDLKAHAGRLLHERMNRSGGVAEFPNVTAEFLVEPDAPARRVTIELATAPEDAAVVKRFEETFDGRRTSFLVSPNLAADKDSLETLSQMQARHLRWAREATGGKRVSPQRLILQTGFYGATPEGAQVLSLLGFNVVGSQTDEIHARFPELRVPGHTHDVLFGPAAAPDEIDALMKRHAERSKGVNEPGVPFNFADEVCCRPEIGKDPKALARFHAWLAERRISAQELGAARMEDVLPIENPKDLRQGEQANGPAARRVFYYTCRFRQLAGCESILQHTQAFHRYFPPGLLTSTLVADHPYFGGTGLGMGMEPNTTWGGSPLALDWFDMARRHAVDLAGIEDWMGLQYMYGPSYTWEGFQLMGFQAAIFRSGSQGTLPIIAWITPSDETNLRLKTASALCQGAKNFYYWTYGPTCFGTENYWSDLRGEYDGIARVARQLAAAEPILAPGKTRRTRVALLYSVSSDIWQPFGYVPMLERRATYLSLVHDQYLVDMLTEEDVDAGRLKEYDVLYTVDPCISTRAAAAIEAWVRAGGFLYGACGAGSRSEFNEEAPGLAKAFGIRPAVRAQVQDAEYRYRGSLNRTEYTDRISLPASAALGASAELGVVGVKVAAQPAEGKVLGRFQDGSPAVIANHLGKGTSLYFGACPGLSYLKEANFVPAELKEQYPALQRRLIDACARLSGAPRLVELSSPVVEAGVYDAPAGTALVLANFTYQPLAALAVRLPVSRKVAGARSVESGPLKLSLEPAPKALKDAGTPWVASFTLPLGLSDIVLLE